VSDAAPGLGPTRAGAPRWEDLVIVGETLRAHGVRGDLLARGVSDDPNDDALLRLSRVFVARGPDTIREMRVASARRLGDRLAIRFEGVATREEAVSLSSHYLMVPTSEAPPLPDGRLYTFQLIGFSVTNEKGDDLGTITGVVENPGNDLWAARGARGEFLIPAVDAIVKRVDLDARRVVIDPIPGLLPE
jgi:16S rRNA processing protein RimM